VSGASPGSVPGSWWRVVVVMRRAYGASYLLVRHPLSDLTIIAVTVAVAVGSWLSFGTASVLVMLVLALVVGSKDQLPARAVVLICLLGVFAGLRADVEHDRLLVTQTGVYQGWARLIDEPKPYDGSTRVVLEIEGDRFELWARGRGARLRVAEWRAGTFVHVRGERVTLDDERRGRVAWQHVVGEFVVEWVSDIAPGGPVDRASNRVRATIESGAATLPGDDSALFRGLVIGDDRDQPTEMIERFRASGMSHLTAVSGQNVSFLLAAAGPLLRALRPWARWAATIALVAWFVSLTRFEPSIVRAGAMAAISATAYVLGRERSPARLLWLAVAGLLLIDPLLVQSVGFWLSVGATAGVAVIGPWLAPRLACLGSFAVPVAVTLGAQAGVVLPVLLVFGRLPLVSVPANLLAVPVAGFVMLYGLPAGLLAGSMPPIAPVVMFPCRLGVRWVDSVAVVAQEAEPGGAVTVMGWIAMVAVVLVVLRQGDQAGTRRDEPGSPDIELP